MKKFVISIKTIAQQSITYLRESFNRISQNRLEVYAASALILPLYVVLCFRKEVKMRKFYNVSNHPSSKWTGLQRIATGCSEIVDIQFPNIDPRANAYAVRKEAEKIFVRILGENAYDLQNVPCMVQGEFTFTFFLTNMLLACGANVVVATSERKVVEKGNEKVTTFEFVEFRSFTKNGPGCP